MEYDDHDEDDFSMSSYDGEQGDSLVIKPPQAVVQRKEKREKRRDRHRHKSDRHKDHHKSRERRVHDERRREHRRHRERDGNRRELKKHSRERIGKHETFDLRSKLDRDQFDDSLMTESLFQKRYRDREEFYVEEREYDRGRAHANYRERHYNEKDFFSAPSSESTSQDRVERDKRMEKFLQAEMQKELSQREADARRQKREEEKREEKMIEELRQKAQASMMRRSRSSPRGKESRSKRRKTYSPSSEDPEIMEVIVDEKKAKNPHEDKMEYVSDEEEISNASSSQSSEESEEQQDSPEVGEDSVAEEHDDNDENRSPAVNSEPGAARSRSPTPPQRKLSQSDSRSTSEEISDKEYSNEENSGGRSRSHSRSSSQSISSSASTEEEENEKDNDAVVKIASPKTSPLAVKLPVYYPAIMGCRSVDEFECLNRIEEGTYGVVYRAREKTTDQIVALKRLKMEKEKEGFPITSLREVNTLLKGQHENIVTVREIVVGSNMDKIYIVMDYVEHDLKSLMEMMRHKKQSFTIGELKTLMIQLLRAVHHLHDNWILHRDLKTSNLLLSHRGILKVGDFGLAREYGSPLKAYTPIVVTLWYRAPELLLGTKLYACPIDVWSVGCIFGELLGMESMFPGKSEIDQLNRIFKDLGSPSEKIWPGYNQLPVVKKTQFANFQYNHLRERYKTRLSDEGFNLLNRFLTYNPSKRINCVDALKHDYFLVESPPPIDPAMFPTWPAKSENPYGRAKKSSPKPPSGGKNFKELGDGEDESIAGFFLGGEAPRGPGFTLKF